VRFICDDNLGKLAKYLRLLGFDTFFAEPIADSELLAAAASQERFLLTRDHSLRDKSHPYGMLLIENDEALAQLSEVIKSLNLQVRTADLFTRCSRCNEVCHSVRKEEIAERAFPYILKTQDNISECRSCRRLYWKGTHYRHLLAELRSVIPADHLVGD
jgi:hypothetical protein